MNKKFIWLIVVIIIVTSQPSPVAEEIEFTYEIALTDEIALSLLSDYLLGGDCLPERVVGYYVSCLMNITKENNQWLVTITYDGLSDDSIRASRIRANLIYQDGQWVKGEIFQTQKCWPGRGHQEFSAKLCI